MVHLEQHSHARDAVPSFTAFSRGLRSLRIALPSHASGTCATAQSRYARSQLVEGVHGNLGVDSRLLSKHQRGMKIKCIICGKSFSPKNNRQRGLGWGTCCMACYDLNRKVLQSVRRMGESASRKKERLTQLRKLASIKTGQNLRDSDRRRNRSVPKMAPVRKITGAIIL